MGPFSVRDIDVKFRTGELTSQLHAWKEGMSEWKPLFKIDELRKVLNEGAQIEEK